MSSSRMQISAEKILGLLAERHSADVFVPQCKNGPTVNGMLMLDAWAMRRSWSKPCVEGYEIKVSRQDFLRDEKWTDYMRYCNRFWFACPAKIIMPEELPQDVGLIWTSSAGGSLLTKRKAVHREVQIPEGLWRYIIMCRARIVHSYANESEDRAGLLREVIAKEEGDEEMGRRIAEILSARSEKMRLRNCELEDLLKEYRSLQDFLRDNRIDPMDKYGVRNAVYRLGVMSAKAVPEELVRSLRRISSETGAVAEKIDRLIKEDGENNHGESAK